MEKYFDKIQYLKNFSQDFLQEIQEHFVSVNIDSDVYYLADKDDIIDSLYEILKEYEKKENKEKII